MGHPGKPQPPSASKGKPKDAPVPTAVPSPLPPAVPGPARILHLGGASVTSTGRIDRLGRPLPDRVLMDRWVERLRTGDEGALREVVEAFSERITSVVTGLLR